MGNVIGGPASGIFIRRADSLRPGAAYGVRKFASMVTARGADRQREVAIRLSIGATRWRVQRQALQKPGARVAWGPCRIGLAVLLARLLSAWRAPMDFPVQFDVTPDWRGLLFAR